MFSMRGKKWVGRNLDAKFQPTVLFIVVEMKTASQYRRDLQFIHVMHNSTTKSIPFIPVIWQINSLWFLWGIDHTIRFLATQLTADQFHRDSVLKVQSPGPAVYPKKETGDINKIATIYPMETQLPPTFKRVYNTQDRQKGPAPNAYPVIKEKQDPRQFKVDFMKKMRMGRKAPAYSLGVRHTPRQQQLILPQDEYW